MDRTVVALFDDHSQAESAVKDLIAHGIQKECISVATSSSATLDESESSNVLGSTAAAGLTTGAVVGGVMGLLTGLGVIVAPLGLAIAGPLGGLLAGGVTGAATGGLLGALAGLGVPPEHAHAYAESVRHGSVLVTAIVDSHRVAEVETLLDRDGAVNVHDRSLALREAGHEASPSEPMSPDEWSRIRDYQAPNETPIEHEQNVMRRERARVATYVRQEPPSSDAAVPDGRREVNKQEQPEVYDEILGNGTDPQARML